MRQLASLYVALLDEVGATDVTVIGNSIGGWIAAEIALLASPRVSGVVLVDAVGIEVPGHPVADYFSLTLNEVFDLSYFNPAPFIFDPATLPPEVVSVQAGNRASLSTYAGTSMIDATLEERLSEITVPVLVVWGDSDRIVDVDYGRAFAEAIPTARLHVISQSGHLPQLETPQQLGDVIWAFATPDAASPRMN